MTIEIANVQRMRVWTESSIATDGTGTLANYTDVPFIEGSAQATLDTEVLDPQLAYQHQDQISTRITGLKRCTLSFSMNLAPTGTAGASGVAAVQGALGEILKAVMGGETLSTGDDVAASPSPTTTSFTVADASGNSIKAGQVVGLNSGASSAYEMRTVEEVSTNAVTLKYAVTNAPSSTDDVYGTATYYLTQVSQAATLQFILEGLENQDRWLLQGMQLQSMTIETPLGQLPRIQFQFQGVTYTHGADCSTDLTASSLGTATYSNVDVIHTTGEFHWQTVGTTTINKLNVSSITFTPSLSYAMVTAPHATQIVSSWKRTRSAPVMQVEFMLPYEDQTHFTARDNKTLKMAALQIGNVAGSSVLIEVPTMQIINVQKSAADQISSQTVTAIAKLDSDTTEGTATDQGQSAFRIALG